MIPDNEAFYDERILPLVTQIHELCAGHNLPFLLLFQTQRDQLATTCQFTRAADPLFAFVLRSIKGAMEAATGEVL